MLMACVVARNPPAATRPVAPIKTPLGLSSQTCPFARRDPSIRVPPVPVIRLSAIDPAPGWMNWTFDPASTENARQSMTALSVCCLIMMSFEPTPSITATPARTVGSATDWAWAASASKYTRQKLAQSRKLSTGIGKGGSDPVDAINSSRKGRKPPLERAWQSQILSFTKPYSRFSYANLGSRPPETTRQVTLVKKSLA